MRMAPLTGTIPPEDSLPDNRLYRRHRGGNAGTFGELRRMRGAGSIPAVPNIRMKGVLISEYYFARLPG